MVTFTSPTTATLTGYATINGKWTQKTMELEKRSDGTWGQKGFGDALQETQNASQSGGVQSSSSATTRRKLTDQEIAELAEKYDVRNMSQAQYDAFLDELVEKGALTRRDTSWLGRGGLVRLDIDMDEFLHATAEGRLMTPDPSMAYVTSADDNSMERLKQTLEEADGDLLHWLGNMLARLSLGIDSSTKEGSRQKTEAINVLRDIIKRM